MVARTKKDTAMRKMKLGANVAIFVLFFGVALIEAFKSRDWIQAAFWVVAGLAFLLADNLATDEPRNGSRHTDTK
jgi:hypothetical protein